MGAGTKGGGGDGQTEQRTSPEKHLHGLSQERSCPTLTTTHLISSARRASRTDGGTKVAAEALRRRLTLDVRDTWKGHEGKGRWQSRVNLVSNLVCDWVAMINTSGVVARSECCLQGRQQRAVRRDQDTRTRGTLAHSLVVGRPRTLHVSLQQTGRGHEILRTSAFRERQLAELRLQAANPDRGANMSWGWHDSTARPPDHRRHRTSRTTIRRDGVPGPKAREEYR